MPGQDNYIIFFAKLFGQLLADKSSAAGEYDLFIFHFTNLSETGTI